MSNQKITISLNSLLLILALFLLIILLWQLRGLLLVLMIATVIAASLAPLIRKAEQLKIPRWLAVLLVYLGLLGIVTIAGLIIGPSFVTQFQRLLKSLPSYLTILQYAVQDIVIKLNLTEPEAIQQINQLFNLQEIAAWLFRSSQQLLLKSYGVTRNIIDGVLTVVLALLLSGYMLAGYKSLIEGIVNLFPKPWDQKLAEQVEPIARKMGGYIQGRVLVSAILGVFITIGLKLLGISEFALSLGVIAGFTNLIPFFGPVLGSIPALLVAIAHGSWTFLWVLLLFVIIQNLETYVLDPLLVGSSVEVAPIYQLLAVLGGAQVLGVLGALIVPPWVAGTSVLLENLYLKPKRLKEMENREIAEQSSSISG
jgi:predicted PurR-regulated permease PerM